LQNIPRIPIAVDAWTSSNRLAFLAIVISFITEDWRYQEVLLDFTELNGAHTGANMAQNIFDTLTEFELRDKVRSESSG